MQDAKVYPEKILVVEDDSNMSSLIETVISGIRPGTQINTAISLEEALTILIKNSDIENKKPYELIVADIFLEGNGTGLDLWRVLRGTYPQIPILVVSSLAEEAVTAQLSADEKNQLIYLKKPFQVTDLKSKLLEVLRKEPVAETKKEKHRPVHDTRLLHSDKMHMHMAQLLILKQSIDWLIKQNWVDSPYGGQNQVQDMLYEARFLTNKFWEDFFFKADNELIQRERKIKEHILQMSDLTPELRDFLEERMKNMETFFN